jgi:hypothetical protein
VNAERREARRDLAAAADGGGARINLSVSLGPMVRFEVQGETCADIVHALDGFERLNQVVDAMFSDLAERVYPRASAEAAPQDGAGE